MPIDTQRLVRTFSELVAVDSPSFGERAMADLLRDKLAALGISCKEDGAGEKLGGTAGNLFARVPGTPGAEALLFCPRTGASRAPGTPCSAPTTSPA